MHSRQMVSLIVCITLNKPGWESNVGKVLDEDAVLYNTALNPQMSTPSDSIYGIRIDVDNIEKTVKTPDELKAQKTLLEQKAEEQNKRIALRKQRLETDIAELEHKPAFKIKQQLQ